MAKVTGPLHSSEARGSVSSLTYNSWRGISTVKARCPIAPRDSVAQVAVRSVTRLLTAHYQTLSMEQYEQWRDYARIHTDPDWTGNPKRLSGYNWFIRINFRRYIVGQEPDSSPPTETLIYNLEGLVASQSDILQISTSWTNQGYSMPGDLYIQTYFTKRHNPGVHPNIYMAVFDQVTVEYDAPSYTNVAATGWYTIFARAIKYNGIVSGWQRTRAKVI